MSYNASGLKNPTPLAPLKWVKFTHWTTFLLDPMCHLRPKTRASKGSTKSGHVQSARPDRIEIPVVRGENHRNTMSPRAGQSGDIRLLDPCREIPERPTGSVTRTLDPHVGPGRWTRTAL